MNVKVHQAVIWSILDRMHAVHFLLERAKRAGIIGHSKGEGLGVTLLEGVTVCECESGSTCDLKHSRPNAFSTPLVERAKRAGLIGPVNG